MGALDAHLAASDLSRHRESSHPPNWHRKMVREVLKIVWGSSAEVQQKSLEMVRARFASVKNRACTGEKELFWTWAPQHPRNSSTLHLPTCGNLRDLAPLCACWGRNSSYNWASIQDTPTSPSKKLHSKAIWAWHCGGATFFLASDWCWCWWPSSTDGASSNIERQRGGVEKCWW